MNFCLEIGEDMFFNTCVLFPYSLIRIGFKLGLRHDQKQVKRRKASHWHTLVRLPLFACACKHFEENTLLPSSDKDAEW